MAGIVEEKKITITKGPRLNALGAQEKPSGLDMHDILKALKEKDRSQQKDAGGDRSVRRKKIKLDELLMFTDQLAVLLEAGVPLLSALAILTDQTQNPRLREIIADIQHIINGGGTLTSALSLYPETFTDFYVAMVRAAEKSGHMVEVLTMISVYLKKESDTAKKLKSAIAYPRFVGIFFMVLLVGILLFLVPSFKKTFESLGSELPGPTLLLLNFSQFIVDHLVIESIILGTFTASLMHLKKTLLGKMIFDKLRLKTPFFGDLTIKTSLSRFCRTLAISLKSSVPIVTALEIAKDTAENLYIRTAITNVQQGVLGGAMLHVCLATERIFPTMVVKMIATGEESGALEKMLNNIADMYDTEIDAKIAGLSSVIEPILMVGLGIIALVVIIALYLPIFNIGNLNF